MDNPFLWTVKGRVSTGDSCGLRKVRDMRYISFRELTVFTYFSKKGVPRILYLTLATANETTSMRVLWYG